jgi:TolB protein
MKKSIVILFFCIFSIACNSAFAMLNLELTRGVAGAVPIAVMPFSTEGGIPSQDVSSIISNDLRNSGRFKVSNNRSGVYNIVAGSVQNVGGGRYQVSFQLLDAIQSKQVVLLNKKYVVGSDELRAVAHHISDMVYQHITGVRGVFSTRLAYIVVQRLARNQTRYILEVSDQDGYNPQPLLTSTDPIMSPAWSPDGKKIAYVSFENRRASIYIEDVATGARRLVTEYQGINGAPAWSPDGRKLALVLSKDGSPNIYILDLASRQLTPITRDWSINTEPAWSPDGKTLIFTSNRGGTPQIYQKNLSTSAISRITYEGKYNARASFTSDGNHLVVLNQNSNLYNIGILDLDSGTFRVLTNSGSDHDSPSVAPNGSMVLFGTVYNGKSVLGMAATDGSVQIRLPARDGEVQDPAWSPFLS